MNAKSHDRALRAPSSDHLSRVPNFLYCVDLDSSLLTKNQNDNVREIRFFSTMLQFISLSICQWPRVSAINLLRRWWPRVLAKPAQALMAHIVGCSGADGPHNRLFRRWWPTAFSNSNIFGPITRIFQKIIITIVFQLSVKNNFCYY